MFFTVSQYKRRNLRREAGTPKIAPRDERQNGGGLRAGRGFLLFKIFYDFTDVLGAVARTDEDGVVCFHDDQIMDADGGDEFPRSPEVISAGVERKGRAGGNVRAAVRREQIVNRAP